MCSVPAAGDNGFMMMTICWMAFAVFLYFMRPSTVRSIEDNSKPRNDGQVNIRFSTLTESCPLIKIQSISIEEYKWSLERRSFPVITFLSSDMLLSFAGQ